MSRNPEKPALLIVEDDASIRHMVRRLLELSGYRVVEARDGEEAWAILQAEPIQLVVTDWLMPRLDGVALTARLRERGEPYIYVILLTAREGPDSMLDGLNAGADDFLSKPFAPNELRARVAIGARIVALEQALRKALAEQRSLAEQDALTGLLNRGALFKRASLELERAVREGNDCTLILLDVDHFKQVNDSYGHPMGDMVLRKVAALVQDEVRPYDLVGRWGGEEFALLLPRLGAEEARAVAERVRATLSAWQHPLPNGTFLRVTASLGVSTTAHAGPSFSGLVARADEALYRAKRAGRNRVCLADPTGPDAEP